MLETQRRKVARAISVPVIDGGRSFRSKRRNEACVWEVGTLTPAPTTRDASLPRLEEYPTRALESAASRAGSAEAARPVNPTPSIKATVTMSPRTLRAAKYPFQWAGRHRLIY